MYMMHAWVQEAHVRLVQPGTHVRACTPFECPFPLDVPIEFVMLACEPLVRRS